MSGPFEFAVLDCGEQITQSVHRILVILQLGLNESVYAQTGSTHGRAVRDGRHGLVLSSGWFDPGSTSAGEACTAGRQGICYSGGNANRADWTRRVR